MQLPHKLGAVTHFKTEKEYIWVYGHGYRIKELLQNPPIETMKFRVLDCARRIRPEAAILNMEENSMVILFHFNIL